jgi:protein-glutamine gamma-glutamyltransferase
MHPGRNVILKLPMASSIATPASNSLPADRFYRTALFFLVLTAVMTLVGTGKLDLFSTILAPALVLYKGVRWWREQPPELPHSLATRLVVLYVLIFPIDLLFISRALAGDAPNPALYAGLLAVVHFLLFVTLVRFYSVANDRDALFLSMLAFACVLASAIFTVDTSFLGFFVVFLLFAVAVFVGLEIRRGATGAVFPPVGVDRFRERKFNRALFLAAFSVALGAVLIGTVLFFVFPRFSAGYFARTGLQPELMSGFTDNVELGQIGEIKKNNTIVMRVQTGAPVNYPMLRWRGIALTDFDGHRWYTKKRRNTRDASNGWIPLAARRDLEGHPAVQVEFITLLQPMASDALFGPSQVMALRGNFSGEAGTYDGSARRSYVQVDSTGSIYNPFHNFSQIRYEGISILPVARPAEARKASTDYPDEIRNTYLQLPEQLDPRIPELAKKVTASANNPYDQALLLESYFHNNFTYTLNITGKPGADPLARFLFDTKAGFCEYFATAMAVMLRTQGIPSREVNGFLPGEYNDVGGDYIVRASDAHSWVEAYFPGSGWITFDPTPPSNEAPAGLLSRLALYVDWFQLTWNEWVINYDFSHQVSLARNVGQTSTDWKDRWRKKAQRFQDHSMEGLAQWQRSHNKLRFIFPIVLVLILPLLRLNYFLSFIRWLRFSWLANLPEGQRNAPQMASRLYAELLRLLEKRGISRLATQTPREFAASLALQGGIASAVQEFTDLYVRSRFGGLPCDAFRLRTLLEQVRSTPRPR